MVDVPEEDLGKIVMEDLEVWPLDWVSPPPQRCRPFESHLAQNSGLPPPYAALFLPIQIYFEIPAESLRGYQLHIQIQVNLISGRFIASR